MASAGTLLYTWLCGRSVGTDEFGNRYFTERRRPKGRPGKRWVLFAGRAEASNVPPGWHAWLLRNLDEPPSNRPLPTQRWEQTHQPNLTGTPAAYRPPGHTLSRGKRAPATGDYEPWRPE